MKVMSMIDLVLIKRSIHDMKTGKNEASWIFLLPLKVKLVRTWIKRKEEGRSEYGWKNEERELDTTTIQGRTPY